MTRYAMVADLRRCVGCQTCTAACKETRHAAGRAVAPRARHRDRRVPRRAAQLHAHRLPALRIEPPCLEVCPSTATRKRGDGIVTIDETLCIGCSACIMACPTTRATWSTRRCSRSASRPCRTNRLADKARVGGHQVRLLRGPRRCRRGARPGAWRRCRGHAGVRAELHLGRAAVRRHRRSGEPVSKLLAENRWFRMRRARHRAGLRTTCGTRRPPHDAHGQPAAAAAAAPAPLGLARCRQLHRRRHRQRPGAGGRLRRAARARRPDPRLGAAGRRGLRPRALARVAGDRQALAR